MGWNGVIHNAHPATDDRPAPARPDMDLLHLHSHPGAVLAFRYSGDLVAESRECLCTVLVCAARAACAGSLADTCAAIARGSRAGGGGIRGAVRRAIYPTSHRSRRRNAATGGDI